MAQSTRGKSKLSTLLVTTFFGFIALFITYAAFTSVSDVQTRAALTQVTQVGILTPGEKFGISHMVLVDPNDPEKIIYQLLIGKNTAVLPIESFVNKKVSVSGDLLPAYTQKSSSTAPALSTAVIIIHSLTLAQ